MIKNLFNKLFNRGTKVNETEVLLQQVLEQNKMLQEQLNNSRKYEVKTNTQTLREDFNVNKNLSAVADEIVVDSANSFVRKDVETDKLSWKELNSKYPEIVIEMKGDLRDELYSIGIDNIKASLQNKRTELLQDYLTSLLYTDGSYSPEWDNLDSYSREQIIDSIVEISFDNFKEAMKRKGFEVKPPSEGQLKKLKELGYIGEMPMTSLGASKLIESVVGKTDNTPSNAQREHILKLTKRLGFQGEDYTFETKAEASKIIAELQKIADETLGAEKASEKQIEYYARLLKQNKQRFVGKKKEFAENATKVEISKAIEELKEEIAKNHPEVSEGQVDYIISLHQRLMLQFNKSDIEKLTKEEGTDLIDKLNRQVLYMETRRYQASLTMEKINLMSRDEVRDMLKQIQADKKDRNAV